MIDYIRTAGLRYQHVAMSFRSSQVIASYRSAFTKVSNASLVMRVLHHVWSLNCFPGWSSRLTHCINSMLFSEKNSSARVATWLSFCLVFVQDRKFSEQRGCSGARFADTAECKPNLRRSAFSVTPNPAIYMFWGQIRGRHLPDSPISKLEFFSLRFGSASISNNRLMQQQWCWVCRCDMLDLLSLHGHHTYSPVPSSDVLARPGLKATALARLLKALAS